MTVFRFKDVWEMYRVRFAPREGRAVWENFWALRGIDLEISRGECVGILGENGAGKSTLLKLMAGLLKPDRGEIVVNGKVAGLLELGAGFQPELTGQENVVLCAGLFGLGRKEIDARYPSIAEFASLGKFIDAPVKCYSQGMFVRLAFAIAIHMDSDILLVDDSLSVGDVSFQRRCLEKVFALKEKGRTIVFVTHDLDLLFRLASRVLLMKEGRIVRDGLPGRIVPLGAQMAGERSGVVVLEKGPLGMIFNHGRMWFHWDQKPMTSGSGGHASFRCGERWYHSFEAAWEIVEQTRDRFVARGCFPVSGLTQIWRVHLEDSAIVTWDVSVESDGKTAAEEVAVNLMLAPAYRQWSTVMKEGAFAGSGREGDGWEVLHHGAGEMGSLGAFSPDAVPDVPALVFEPAGTLPGGQARVFRADFPAGAGVLQQGSAGTPARFSGRIVFDVLDLKKYMRSREDLFSLSSGRSRICFDQGQGIVLWEDTALTRGRHIWVSVCVAGSWRHSYECAWETQRIQNDRLIARGRWHGWPLVLVWDLSSCADGHFVLKVDVEAEGDIEIERQRLSLSAIPEYGRWGCDLGQGEFPKEFVREEQDILPMCIPAGVLGLRSDQAALPVLTLRSPEAPDRFGKILNSDFIEKTRVLRFERVEAGVLQPLSPLFRVDIDLGEPDPSGKRVFISPSFALGGLKFVLDPGRGHLIWARQELTQDLGLYTSLRSGGRWHDSFSSASWQVRREPGDLLVAEGRWRHVPLRQLWEIRPCEGPGFEWRVVLIVDAPFPADRLQANLMISQEFSEWQSGSRRGSFPPFRNDVDDDWELVASGEKTVEAGPSPGTGGPRITLSDVGPASAGRLAVVNADICHRSRVLQFADRPQGDLKPGEFLFFHGRIQLQT